MQCILCQVAVWVPFIICYWLVFECAASKINPTFCMHVETYCCKILTLVYVRELMFLKDTIFIELDETAVTDFKHIKVLISFQDVSSNFKFIPLTAFNSFLSHKHRLICQQMYVDSNNVTRLFKKLKRSLKTYNNSHLLFLFSTFGLLSCDQCMHKCSCMLMIQEAVPNFVH